MFNMYNHINVSFLYDYITKMGNSDLTLCVIELLKFSNGFRYDKASEKKDELKCK